MYGSWVRLGWVVCPNSVYCIIMIWLVFKCLYVRGREDTLRLTKDLWKERRKGIRDGKERNII